MRKTATPTIAKARAPLSEASRRVIVKLLEKKSISLSQRQLKLLDFMIKNNKKPIDVTEYIKKYKVVQETARKDLSQMVEYGILNKTKSGEKYVYSLNEIVSVISSLNEN